MTASLRVISRLLAASVSVAVLAGCGRCGDDGSTAGEPKSLVPLGSVEKSRRAAFVHATIEALKAFEDLDIPSLKFSCHPSEEEAEAILVRSESKSDPSGVEKAIGLALANIALKYPGIGFVSEGERTWRILLPGEMSVQAGGAFDFGCMGMH